MHSIKIYPKQGTIKLNGITYKGHFIGKIPNNFCNPELESSIKQWFNYKGFTYLID